MKKVVVAGQQANIKAGSGEIRPGQLEMTSMNYYQRDEDDEAEQILSGSEFGYDSQK